MQIYKKCFYITKRFFIYEIAIKINKFIIGAFDKSYERWEILYFGSR